MKATVAKEKMLEDNPALQRVADALTGAFAEVGERIRLELKAAYRRDAKLRFQGLMETAKNLEYQGFVGDSRRGWYEYAKFDRDAAVKEWEKNRKSKDDYSSFPPNGVDRWDDFRKFEKFVSVDYYYADQHSKSAYERARNSFIHKNMRKIENVLGARQDVGDVAVKFAYRRGAFEGDVRVALADGFFRAEVGLKYVIRTIPHLTPYFQYPLLFVEAEIGGKCHKCQSEKELKEVLAGEPS